MMKMSLTWRYITSSGLSFLLFFINRINLNMSITKKLLFFVIILPIVSIAQKEPERQVFIRTGIDLSRFAMPFINDFGPKVIELSFDTEVKYKYFPTIEVGFSKIEDHTDQHTYDSYGNYFRVGLDYSTIKYKHRLDRSIFFVGARYGFTSFSHEADWISISNQWGTYETSLPETQLNAHWVEGVIGLRGEIFNNFYMGYAIRLKSWVSHSDYGDYTPYWVPGYGLATKKITVGMSYSIFYAIPLKKLQLDFEE